MLHDGDIGVTGRHQFFAVKEHVNGNLHECYWSVFIDDSVIDLEQSRYYVHYKANDKELRILKSFLFDEGYVLKGNKIIQSNEF